MTPAEQLATATKTMDQMVTDALAARGKAPKEFVCDNGVVLKLHRVPRQLVNDALAKVRREEPRPPVVRDVEKDREYVNDNDPDYLTAIAEHNEKLGKINAAIYLGLGTSIDTAQVKSLGLELPDSEGWIKRFSKFAPDIEVPPAGTDERYIAWLQWYCLTDEDNTILTGYLMGFYGQTREEAVASAVDSFRGDVRGGADNNGSTPSEQPVSQDSVRD